MKGNTFPGHYLSRHGSPPIIQRCYRLAMGLPSHLHQPIRVNPLKRESHHHNPMARHDRGQDCIALVDGRYLNWLLASDADAQGEDKLNRHALQGVFTALLQQWGLNCELRRIYWYTDQHDGQYPNDQVVRLLASHQQDSGASMLRSVSTDLTQLVNNRACQHILLVSDDERLTPLIDQAQLHGVSVHLICDESSRHLSKLVETDPGWTRMLEQADRRIVMHSQAIRDLLVSRHASPDGAPLHALGPDGEAPDPEVVRAQLQEVVQTWWNEEPEDIRLDLREELQDSRGIPQEVDRHLLLQVRKVLERTLSFQEKKLLRDMVRNVVLEKAPEQ